MWTLLLIDVSCTECMADDKFFYQQFGIEFGYVGGDPAELMRICVENGTFTIAFLREGVQKVGQLVILTFEASL